MTTKKTRVDMSRVGRAVDWICIAAAAVMVFVGCALAGCAVDPAGPTDPPDPADQVSVLSTSEQAICNPGDDCPGGHPSHCTPIGACTDANVQNGTCCPHYGTPAPAPIEEVHCGDELDGTPTCISTNRYFDGSLIQIECVTVIQWLNDGNGGLTRAEVTDCHYY